MSQYDIDIKLAKKFERTKEYLRASFYFTNALKIANKNNDSDHIKFCKSKLIEVNKKSLKQMKEYNFTQKIKISEINKIISVYFKDKKLNKILTHIGKSQMFCPKFNEVKKISQDTMPVTYQLVSIQSISDKGYPTKDGTDGIKLWLYRLYDIQQQLITTLLLRRVFEELTTNPKLENKLDKENLVNFLKQSKIFNDNQLEIIGRGIERYFSKDYISSMQILVPMFENVFLKISNKLGINITKLNQGKEISIQTKTLSEWHFEEKEFINNWGEDLCQQLKFVLYSPLGYKLRYKVAHGEMDAKEYNYNSSNLIIYFYIVLVSRITIKKIN